MKSRPLALISLLWLGTTSLGTAIGDNLHSQANSVSQNRANSTHAETTSSAQGGVKLLEHILQRMRNSPQLAISKTKQTIAFKSQALIAQNDANQGELNLLIKPKDLSRGKTAAQGASSRLALLAGANNKPMPAPTNEQRSAGDGIAGTGAPNSVWERPEGASFSTEPVSSDAAGGIANVKEYGAKDDAGSLKQEQAKRVIASSPLITEFDRFAGRPASPVIDAAPVADQQLPANLKCFAKNVRAGHAQVSVQVPVSAPAPAQTISDPALQMQDMTCPTAPAAHFLKKNVEHKQKTGLQQLAQTLSTDSLVRHMEESEAINKYAMHGYSNGNLGFRSNSLRELPAGKKLVSRDAWQARSTSMRRDLDIAILPPTVITGIPLIRLGNSEKEVAKAFASFKELGKENVHGWSVWTVRKPGCHDCAIQIFMRHGMVDAIRIFDSSFLRPDLGVNLGDGIAAVKEKFGEPSFILSDQATISAQNYIYPISQIGFQTISLQPGAIS